MIKGKIEYIVLKKVLIHCMYFSNKNFKVKFLNCSLVECDFEITELTGC